MKNLQKSVEGQPIENVLKNNDSESHNQRYFVDYDFFDFMKFTERFQNKKDLNLHLQLKLS